MPRGRRNAPRAVPSSGGFGMVTERPTGRAVGPAEVTLRPTGMNYTWEGQAVITAFNDVLQRGFESLADFAQDYWMNEEWTTGRHPYMTGEERNSGFFIVGYTPDGRVDLQIGAEVRHAIFEEYGTVNRPGHFPIRNTLDRVAYRFSDAIRAAAKAEGLA